MKSAHLLILIISLLAVTNGFTQEISPLQNINVKLFRYAETKSPEKTYIHTDKDIYLNGETIWYKAYLVDGISHSISDKSKVVYIELVNALDSVLVKQKLFNENFGADGNIELLETFEPGNYTLRAYTKYMLNEKEPVIFSKQITIWESNNFGMQDLAQIQKDAAQVYNTLEKELVLDFFPEGGTLVYGIQNTMGIKITDTQGNEIATSVKIIDQNNTLIKDFETHEFGLGKFSYLPDTGNSYYASVTLNGLEKKYPLPLPENKGYGLNLVQNAEQITVRVASNITNGLKGVLLIGHIRGRVFLQHNNEKARDESYLVKIPIENLEEGVAHFTLFTPAGEPVCERLVFINNPENDNLLNIETSWPVYNKRQKVDVQLILESMADEELSGNFSAAIISDLGIKSNVVQNMESWLLLNSDVGGTIDNAGFFFEEDSVKKRYLLDALMLTHGWRRFVWQEMLAEKVSSNLSFQPEKGIMVQGFTTAFKNKYQQKASSVSLTTIGSELYNERMATDDNGNFSFGPYVFQDTIQAVIETKPMNISLMESENEFSILVNEFYPTLPTQGFPVGDKNNIKYTNPNEYIAIATQNKIYDFKNLSARIIKLDEITVADKKKALKEIIDDKINSITIHKQPDKRIFIDSIPALGSYSIPDLLINIPGVSVTGNRGNQSIFLRGGKPLILLDGMMVDLTFINLVSPDLIEFIDILKGPSAGAYGARALFGAIVMYSRGTLGFNSYKQKTFPNITNITVKGFHKTREFYSPKYDQPKVEHKLQDYRTTLHWQPNININENGTSAITFFTGDVPGRYIIYVEGITADGIPISKIQTFEVEE
jgi:hypothetical protein